FVAVAYNGTNRVMTSPDGITWTSRTAGENNWNSITYGNDIFVAVATDGTNRVMTSPDGITWTSRAAAEDNQWRSVTYGNGLFVAVTQKGTNRVMTAEYTAGGLEELPGIDHGFVWGTESDLVGGDTATSSLGEFTSVG